MKELKLILTFLLPILFLSSCVKDSLHEAKMSKIEGSYVLTERGNAYMPNVEFDLIKEARLYKVKGTWVFEYTIPIMSDSVIYHHIVQEVEWNETLKEYIFHRLTERDTANTTLDPGLVKITVEKTDIVFRYRANDRTYYRWCKTK